MPETQRMVLNENDLSTFDAVLNLLGQGWEKDSSVGYNPYGTERVRILHLIRYSDEERAAMAAGAEEAPEPTVVDRIVVELDTDKSRKAALEKNEKTPYEALKERGYVEGHVTSTKAVMVLKKTVVSPPEETVPLGTYDSVLPDPEQLVPPVPAEPGAETTKEKCPVCGLDKDVCICNYVAQRKRAQETIPIQDGTGRVVKELDASPEAVAEAQRKMDQETPPTEEESPTIADEAMEASLGCLTCNNDATCATMQRRVYYNQLMEEPGMGLCPEHTGRQEQ